LYSKSGETGLWTRGPEATRSTVDLGHGGGGDLTGGVRVGGYGHGGRPRCSEERKLGMGNVIWVSPEDGRRCSGSATVRGGSG
jgi:hypothetical protein